MRSRNLTHRTECIVPGCPNTIFGRDGETGTCLNHRGGRFPEEGSGAVWVDVESSNDRTIRIETYRGAQSNAPHRLNGPAMVMYDRADRSRKFREEWWVNGVGTRLDGPAVIEYREDGSLSREIYLVDSRVHRTDGPARITYFRSQVIEEVAYIVNGTYHRIGGPAQIEFSSSGEVAYEEWQVHGERVDDAAEHAELIGAWKPEDLRDGLAQAGFGDVLGDDASLYAVVKILGQDVRTVEGVRAVLDGSPAEWVRSFEESGR